MLIVCAVGLTGASSAGVATAGAAPQPVVVGDICSCTGPAASSIGQTSEVVNAWASWVNARGGLDGHPVEIVVKDDGANPSTSLTDVTELVQQDHVAALLDNSSEDTTWAGYMAQEGVPVLGGGDTVASTENPDFFVPGATFNNVPAAEAAAARSAGMHKLADLFCAEIASCAQAAYLLKPALARVGIPLAYSAQISGLSPSYAAQCRAAKRAGADGMVLEEAAPVVVRVAETCAARHYTPRQLSGGTTVSTSWLASPSMAGNVDVQPDRPWFLHDAATKPMYTALDQYAPSVPAGPDFGEVVVEAWAAGALLQAATHHLGTAPSPAAIIDGLHSLSGTTLGGLSPPLHFAKGKPADNGCFFLMGIEHKRFVALHHGRYFCVGS